MFHSRFHNNLNNWRNESSWNNNKKVSTEQASESSSPILILLISHLVWLTGIPGISLEGSQKDFPLLQTVIVWATPMMGLGSRVLGILLVTPRSKDHRSKKDTSFFWSAKLKAQPATLKPAQSLVYFLLSIQQTLFVAGISTSKIY